MPPATLSPAKPDPANMLETKVPPAIAAQAADAAARHAAAYPGQAPRKEDVPQPPQPAPITPQPDPAVVNPPAQPDPPKPTRPPAAATPPADVPETGADGSWQHRFHAMKGRWEQAGQQIGSLQEQLTEMGDELMRVNQLLQMSPQERQAARPGSVQQGQAPRLVTPQDVETYSPELIDLIGRAARDAVAPDINNVAKQVKQTSQRVGQMSQADVMATLKAEVPDWETINHDPRFKQWCALPDVYSRQIRGKLLNAAFNAADAPTVVAFFKGFLAEEQATGQIPAPQPQPPVPPVPRQAAVALDTLTAPGRPKPAGGDAPVAAADKPVFTRGQIKGFYNLVRQGHYNGREQDKANDEALIFAAQREGRVRD